MHTTLCDKGFSLHKFLIFATVFAASLKSPVNAQSAQEIQELIDQQNLSESCEHPVASIDWITPSWTTQRLADFYSLQVNASNETEIDGQELNKYRLLGGGHGCLLQFRSFGRGGIGTPQDGSGVVNAILYDGVSYPNTFPSGKQLQIIENLLQRCQERSLPTTEFPELSDYESCEEIVWIILARYSTSIFIHRDAWLPGSDPKDAIRLDLVLGEIYSDEED